MLTTSYISQSFKAIERKLDLSIYKKQEKEQKETEDRLINNFQPCPANTAAKPNPIQIKELKLNTLRRKEYYNANLMEFISCMTDVIFNAPNYKSGLMAETATIKSFINNVKQIGTESVNGYAMRASFKKAQDFYILKSARNLGQDELTHELAVGLLGTNKLRRFCPNFAYIYGGFKCSLPIIEEKEVKAFCSNKESKDRNGLQYVVYENIENAKSIAEYCQTCTPQQFLQVYLQVLYALNKAVDVCDFTHYDLHSENVLIRPLPKGDKAYITCYTEKGQVEYMEVENIATIIDFGNSHIIHEGKPLGTFGLEAYSTMADVSFPMYDAYKLLMFCATNMGNNPNTLEIARYIFNFFNNKEDITQALNDQMSFYYSLPYTVDTYRTKLTDLTSYIRKIYNCSFITSQPSAGIPLLVCRNDCLSVEEINSQLKDLSAPSTLWSLYDRALEDVRYDYSEDYDRLISSFEDEGEKIVEKINTTLDILDKDNISFSPNSTYKITPQRVTSFVDNVFILNDLINYAKVMVAIQYAFNRDNEYFDQIATFISDNEPLMKEYIKNIKNNENREDFGIVKDKIKYGFV